MNKGFVSFINGDTATPAITAMNRYLEDRLSRFASMMPDGKFINGHNDEEDKCLAIVITAQGDICPVHHLCCLNPLKIRKVDDKETVWLSTFSCGGNVDCRGGVVEGIEKFNQSYAEGTFDFLGNQVIFAAWIF